MLRSVSLSECALLFEVLNNLYNNVGCKSYIFKNESWSSVNSKMISLKPCMNHGHWI